MDFGGASNAARARVVGLGYDEVPKTIMKQPATPRATLTTSAIMKRTGLGRNALRFYKEKDSSDQERTAAGYRLYSPAVLLDL